MADAKPNADEIRSQLETLLKTFDDDPADSDYQRGYEQALYDVLMFANRMKITAEGGK